MTEYEIKIIEVRPSRGSIYIATFEITSALARIRADLTFDADSEQDVFTNARSFFHDVMSELAKQTEEP